MDDVDLLVGRRIRGRRHELGLAQDYVARQLGVTFQQLQKYEKGQNRVSAGRLHCLCGLLGVPAGYFFEQAAPLPVRGPADEFLAQVQGDRIARRLNVAFLRIDDSDLRAAIVALVERIADAPGGDAASVRADAPPPPKSRRPAFAASRPDQTPAIDPGVVRRAEPFGPRSLRRPTA